MNFTILCFTTLNYCAIDKIPHKSCNMNSNMMHDKQYMELLLIGMAQCGDSSLACVNGVCSDIMGYGVACQCFEGWHGVDCDERIPRPAGRIKSFG